MGDGFARIFGRARELKGLGAVEGGCQADFAGFFAVDLDGMLERGGVVVWKWGTYAFEGGFRGRAGFGIVFATYGGCEKALSA